MATAPFLSLVNFAFIVSITPGPNNLLLVSSGAPFGWRRAPPFPGDVASARPWCVHEAILLQWVNPKAVLIAVSAAGACFAIAQHLWHRLVILVGVLLVTGLFVCSLWMFAGSALHRTLFSGRYAALVNFLMGLLILATALVILLI